MWRLLMDRIPTKVALQRRHINVGSPMCIFCVDQEETVDHLFTGCIVATGVWNVIARWVELPQFFFFSVKDIMQEYEGSKWSVMKKAAFHGVMVITCWRIWKARNDKIFREVDRSVVDIVADVKALSFLWFSSRYKKGSVGWEDWKKFDFDVM
ncbi:putative reverse transcriptase zinc-binding domain-containing protein [Helianthus anomalus]